jgi:hypothetical protein
MTGSKQCRTVSHHTSPFTTYRSQRDRGVLYQTVCNNRTRKLRPSINRWLPLDPSSRRRRPRSSGVGYDRGKSYSPSRRTPWLPTTSSYPDYKKTPTRDTKTPRKSYQAEPDTTDYTPTRPRVTNFCGRKILYNE